MKGKLHNNYWSFLILTILLLPLEVVQARQKQDIHDMFSLAVQQRMTRAGDVINVNLAEYEEITTYTLSISDGKKYRFYGGKLGRAKGSWENGALVELSNGSELTLDEGATLDGGSFKASNPVVNIKGGTLRIIGGQIIGTTPDPYLQVFTTNTVSPDATLGTDRPVVMNENSDVFVMTAGYVEGEVTCSATDATVQITGGSIKCVEGYHVTTLSDVHIAGNLGNTYYSTKGKKVFLRSAITDSLRVDFRTKLAIGDCVVEGENYTITQADVKKLSMYYKFWEYIDFPPIVKPILSNSRRNIPPGYSFRNQRIPFNFVLKDNKVYLEEIPTPVRTIDDVEPGTLPDRIPDSDNVEELTITGKLNGTDIYLIRSMACKKLKKLDISGCSIVKGGDVYLKDGAYTPAVKVKTAKINVGDLVIIPFLGHPTSDNEVGSYMFANLSVLEELILPNTVTSIGRGAFMESPKLHRIVIGNNLKAIETPFLFYESNLLTDVQIKSSAYVFDHGIIYTDKYRTIVATVPSMVTGTMKLEATVDSIVPYAFAGCDNLTNVSFPSGLTRIGEHAFAHCGLTKVQLPASLKSIGVGSFLYCQQLDEVSFPQGLEEIGGGAFAYCNLKSIDISMTQVKRLRGDEHSYPIAVPIPTYTYYLGVFEGNNNLTSVSLPETIEQIGGKVFTSSKLSDIYCHNLPSSISYKYVFQRPEHQLGGSGFESSDTFVDVDYKTCRLHVPSNTVSKYREATGWKEFANIVGDQPKVASDPNVITDEEWLQTRLNEIAENTPNKATELTIQDEGITISKSIYFKANCKVTLTGGKITIANPLSFTSDMVFNVYQGADVTFKDITLDFNGLPKSNVSYFYNAGKLTISQNVEYKNITTNAVKGYFYHNLQGGILNVNSGDVVFNGTVLYTEGRAWLNGGTLKGVSASSPVLLGKGNDEVFMYNGCNVVGDCSLIVDLTKFYMWGGLLQGSNTSTLVAERTTCSLGGGRLVGGRTYGNGSIGTDTEATYPQFDLQSGRIDVTTRASFVTVWGQLPEIYLSKDAVIASLFYEWNSSWPLTINADWKNMKTRHVLIENLSQSDYGKITFKDLKKGSREVEYDGNNSQVFYKKFLSFPLDDDDLPDDTSEDNPYQPEIPDGGGVIDDDSDTKPDIHILFGEKKKDELTWWEKKMLIFKNNSRLRVVRTSSVEFAGIEVHGDNGSHVEAEGKVIVSDGAVICGFQNFLTVKEGGKVVWDGGETDNVVVAIDNQGGTVNIKSGKIGSTVRSTTDITANGSVEIGRFAIKTGAAVNVTSQLTQQWTITLFGNDGNEVTSIADGTVVIASTEDYQLTEADLQHVTATLPLGYTLAYDTDRRSIVVRNNTIDGISTASNDGQNSRMYYDLQGRSVLNPQHTGIYINNGKKVIIK